jgi:hypothetical protein
MNKLFPFLIGCTLLGRSLGVSDVSPMTTSVVSTIEQYCFPKPNGSFSTDNTWPSVTMIYSGMTLTATSVAVTTSMVIPTIAPIAAASSASMSGDSITTSDIASGQSSITTLLTTKLPPAASSGLPSIQYGSIVDSGTMTTQHNTWTAGPAPTATNGNTVAEPEMGTGDHSNLPKASGVMTSESAVETKTEAVPTDSELATASTSNVNVFNSISGAVSQSMTDSSPPIVTDGSASLSSSSSYTTAYSRDGFRPTNGMSEPPASTGLPNPVGTPAGPPNQVADMFNATINLSPAALDALQFAQFLKNLGVSVFNSSNSYNRWTVEGDIDGLSLSSLVANISTVCLVTHSILLDE